MKNWILRMRVLFILGCILIATGIFMLGLNVDYWYVVLFWGIFFMGFWAFIMIMNPELKDYGEYRRKRRIRKMTMGTPIVIKFGTFYLIQTCLSLLEDRPSQST